MTDTPPAAITVIVRPPFGFRIAEAAADFIATFTDVEVTVEHGDYGEIIISAGVAIAPPTGAAARQHVTASEAYAASHNMTVNIISPGKK